MKPPVVQRGRQKGFTLAEMLVSTAILAMLIVLMATIFSHTNEAWISGERRVENYQSGRAILELMARELGPAVISSNLQFVQNPAIAGKSDLNDLLPTSPVATTQVPNSDSLFWQTPSTSNAFGNVHEMGYFLATTATTPKKYQLWRFNAPPDKVVTSATAAKTHASLAYWIYDPPTAYNNPAYLATSPWPLYGDAPWLTQLVAGDFQKSIALVSDGVLAFWVRCLDKNGDPIPWLYKSSLYSSSVSTLKFNSAAGFNPATPGVANSFAYTVPPAGTVTANRLPSAVELTIVTLDSRALTQFGSSIPAIPAAASATDVPASIQGFMDALIAQNIKSAQVFSTTVRLINGTD